MNRHFITPSGTSVHLRSNDWRPAKNRDGLIKQFEISSAGTTGPVQVYLDAPALAARVLAENLGSTLTPGIQDELAVSAILRAIDSDPLLIGQPGAPYEVEIAPSNVIGYAARPKLSDRELRRYIARRAYDEFSRTDLDVFVTFDDFDHRITGARPVDLLRNSQVLAAEGYLRLERAMGEANSQVTPTAKIIRDVERYGSAREDAISQQDYAQMLTSYPLLADRREAVLLEYSRCTGAVNRTEIASVFRAIAPLVEGLLRDMLHSKGIERELPTLGPIIGEMQSRSIDDYHLLAQLNHILKFARDLEEHGADLPEPVIRIACANAFELIPQVAAL